MALFYGKPTPDAIAGPTGQRGPGMGLPGAERDNSTMDPRLTAMLLQRGSQQATISKEDVQKAAAILQEYKRGKENLEDRIIHDELWWELRHWESIGKKNVKNPDGKPIRQVEPTSAWLFNAIVQKHADAMDNYPEPVTLPRERSDEESAKILSEVLPVILEYNDFEQVYSDNWWEKLKHGTAVYGVYWNTSKENGLGDIDIRPIDLLKIFWEPGITDIQQSRNLFICELVDDDLLEDQYPQLKGKVNGGALIDVKQYLYDDTVDVTDKSVVVDWYYKVKSPNGRTLLHYAKFVGDELLYASENDPEYRERGFYDHGMYPIVFDTLYPEKGTPVGFGYVSICKDPQLYIDKLGGNILENAMMATKKRFFVSKSTNINEDDFLDWNRPLVRVEGDLSETRLKEIICHPLDSIYVSVLNNKIEEMKDTASNRDVNSGGTGSGVTAAAAIAALQEAGNKASRDMIAASYRSYTSIIYLCVELIRQFYDETRSFRITGEAGGAYQFVDLDNSQLRDQPVGLDEMGQELFRRPVFDIKIKAQKKNPFSRMEQNETAKELYGAGFFNPQRAQEAMIALDMMEFEGIEEVREKVMQGQTLLNMVQQLSQENAMLKLVASAATGKDLTGGMGAGAPAEGAGPPQAAPTGRRSTGAKVKDGIMQAQTPRTAYSQRIAERSRPDMS